MQGNADAGGEGRYRPDMDPVRAVGAFLIVAIGIAVVAAVVRDEDQPPAVEAKVEPVAQARPAPPPPEEVWLPPMSLNFNPDHVGNDPTKMAHVQTAMNALNAECGHSPYWPGAIMSLYGYADGKTKSVNLAVDVHATKRDAVGGNTLHYNVALDRKGRPVSIGPRKEISAIVCFYPEGSSERNFPLNHVGRSNYVPPVVVEPERKAPTGKSSKDASVSGNGLANPFGGQ